MYPALAVLQELGGEVELLWVGAEGGMERDLVSRAGIRFAALPAAGLHGVGPVALPGNLLRLVRGYFGAKRLLREFSPDALFFTGGYVAAPVAMAAGNTPTLAFVPDIEPGFTLRFIARFADLIAVVVDEARQYFRRPERVRVSGYPLRRAIARWTRAEAQKHFRLAKGMPVLLVFGGSKGARSINQALIAALPDLLNDVQIIHVSGENNWAEVQRAQSGLPNELAARYHAFPYLHDDMGAAFAAADLAVCRAGASTLGELPHFGLPAILVPIPLKGHLQATNAVYLEKRGAAMILPDDELAGRLLSVVRDLLNDKSRLARMKAAMFALTTPNAAAQIAGLLRQLGNAEARS